MVTTFNYLGSISSGTMKVEDLLPTFLDVLKDIAPEAHAEMMEDATLADALDADYYDDWTDDQREAAEYTLNSLFDKLNEAAPPYCSFGAHEGDGADYGFWIAWDSINNAVTDGELLKVDDLSDVPDGYRGEVLSVNDHGNATLWTVSHDGWREVWSIA